MSYRNAAITAGLLFAVFTSAGCSGSRCVPSIGNYPLRPDNSINEAIAKQRSEMQEIDDSYRVRMNRIMGKEPDDGRMITFFRLGRY